MCEPLPREMKSGVPPTALKARTGLLTPPTMTLRARAKSASDLARLPFECLVVAMSWTPLRCTARSWLAKEPEELGRVRPHAGEDRRLQLCVFARLRAPELLDERQELCGVVALEREDELLVVDPEGVARVYLDPWILAPHLEVLAHDPLPLGEGQAVPAPHLHEGVDEHVLGPLGDEAF